MFSTNTFENFGKALKAIRNNLGYTRDKVAELTGVNRDTIRRMENNETIPKIETLEILSSCYKVNLLSLLDIKKQNPILIKIYHNIDNILNNPDLKVLKKSLDEFLEQTNKLKPTLFNINELNQFHEYVETISNFYFDKSIPIDTHIETLKKVLSYSNEDFDFDNYKSFTYSFIEIRILLSLSTFLIIKEETDEAIELLKYLHKNIHYFIFDSKLLELSQAKIYYNLSTAYYINEYDEECLKVCNEGIEYCLSNDTMSNLHSLYFRKALILKEMGDPDYNKYFYDSLDLIRVKKNKELLETFKTLAKRHGFEYDELKRY